MVQPVGGAPIVQNIAQLSSEARSVQTSIQSLCNITSWEAKLLKLYWHFSIGTIYYEPICSVNKINTSIVTFTGSVRLGAGRQLQLHVQHIALLVRLNINAYVL